jgi:pyruvate dehydrogenase E2 component (dihydrolipoamide acetyltransferase)
MAAPSLEALADAAASLLDALGHDTAHLVGHSMGGAVAGRLALRGRAKTLTLIDAAGLGSEINMAYIDGFVAAPSRRELKPALQHLFADPGLVSRAMVEDLMKYKRLDGVASFLEALAGALFGGGVQRRSLVAELSALSIPVQVIWGERDAIIPAAHARALPNARVEVIAGAGHMPQMEAAGRVNELIRALVAG